jgi:hypothetical protein
LEWAHGKDKIAVAPDQVGARLRLKPHGVNGRTVVPLTPQPAGTQAWKIVIPITKVKPELKSHEGYEWIYGLSGRMRLTLGEEGERMRVRAKTIPKQR